MNIWTIIFIAACCAMVIHYYYQKHNDETKLRAQGIVDCNEIEIAGKPSVMLVEIPETEEEKVKKFIHDNTDLDFDTHCHLERNGSQLKVTMDKDLIFYDVAAIVNQFAWDAEGLKYNPKAHYHIGKMQIGDNMLTNTEVVIYIASSEDEPSLVNFKTKEGVEYQFDLSSLRAKKL